MDLTPTLCTASKSGGCSSCPLARDAAESGEPASSEPVSVTDAQTQSHANHGPRYQGWAFVRLSLLVFALPWVCAWLGVVLAAQAGCAQGTAGGFGLAGLGAGLLVSMFLYAGAPAPEEVSA
jgi:hypothetical protein